MLMVVKHDTFNRKFSLCVVQKRMNYIWMIFLYAFFRFGPYFCQPVIAGLGDEDKPFICTMDSIGAK